MSDDVSRIPYRINVISRVILSSRGVVVHLAAHIGVRILASRGVISRNIASESTWRWM